MSNNLWYEVGRALRQILVGAARNKARQQGKPAAKRRGSEGTPQPPCSSRSGHPVNTRERAETTSVDTSPGQFGPGKTRDITARELAHVRFEYAPNPDGDPDPGEVIWTWVPYVENDGRGKDRPVLIIGRLDATTVAGCYLSTKYHQDFLSIGSGGWDPQRRESFISPERLLRITHEGMRRESVQVDRKRFESVVAGVRQYHGLA